MAALALFFAIFSLVFSLIQISRIRAEIQIIRDTLYDYGIYER